MTPRTYRVIHRTAYTYSATMSDGYSIAHLVPRTTEYQTVSRSEIEVDPPASAIESYVDLFGNRVHQFGIHEPHAGLVVEAISEVTIAERPEPVDSTPWEQVVEQLDAATGGLAVDVATFRATSHFVDLPSLGRELRAIAVEAFPPGRGIVDGARALTAQIHAGFEFDPAFSDVSTPLGNVLRARRGVCQDFAHLTVGALRSVGLAARYVSGYLETVPPPGQPRLVGADASHAWASVWTPRAGWVDLDPTNGHLPAEHHVTVAWGRDYADVIPVRGVMIGPVADQQLDVAVDVERLP